MIFWRRSTGSGSEVIVAERLRPSVMVPGRPKRTWRRSIRRAKSRGVIRTTGTSTHAPSMSFFSVARRSARNLVMASSIASMAWSRTSASRMAARSARSSMYFEEARSP
jgi:hypothetical protein